MIFQELDKWMLDIEDRKNPTAKERRLHMKLKRVKSETRKRYMVHFEKNRDLYKVPEPSFCMERAMPLYLRKTFHIGEEFNKTFTIKG
jgi:hypothetical protein